LLDRAVLRRGELVLMERPGVHLDFVNIDGEIRSYLKEQGLSPIRVQMVLTGAAWTSSCS